MSIDYKRMLEQYKGKNVLVTGDTGFKGSWMVKVLLYAGANVTGFALEPEEDVCLFRLAGLDSELGNHQVYGDVRDLDHLRIVLSECKPETVIHLAAQPIVREGYLDPVRTYSTNVMGTVNVLEAVRQTPSVRSFLNVTTDKVYLNREWVWGYREDEVLDGYDPYSNSKSCSELATHCYQRSFFTDGKVSISTARAGNVIGGGDFAKDRIIPDCVRAAMAGESIIVRNPHSIRPYQHVLEPVFAYLMIAAEQIENKEIAGWYNIGPDESDCLETGKLVDLFCSRWGDGINWKAQSKNGPHEANYLKLDCSKIKAAFGWKPRWNISTAVEKTTEWTKCWRDGKDIPVCMEKQIKEYMS